MTDELFEQFMGLASRLSPENLHCDGEISRAQANRRYREIMKEWKALEVKLGYKTTEDEVWAIYMAKHT